MPQITVKGLTDAQMKEISTPLVQQLAQAIGCPEDWLILELVPTTFYSEGKQAAGFPIVEVSWFDRPDEVRQQVAQILRRQIAPLGYPLMQVIFTTLHQEAFFEFEE